MEWLGLAALVVVLALSRLYILGRWRNYRFTHRQAAALWASATPLIPVGLWIVHGIDGFNDVLFLGGLVALTFSFRYAMALFFLRAFGGEMDPPSSSGYRRRP
jgi:hypothetical protein